MGLGQSYPCHEGYGRTPREAVLALNEMLHYHYDHIIVRQEKVVRQGQENQRGPEQTNEVGAKPGELIQYFVWNYDHKLPVRFTQCRGRVKAYVIVE